MSTALTLPAPAKLNLFLHITGKRPDGYHNLQTLFQLLDYGDELTFAPRPSNEIVVESSINSLNTPDNLVYRAAKALQQRAGTCQGVHITLRKHLPMGGGIGGGSSDAATTLLGLNHLWQCQLPESDLLTLGAQLGADIPVFIRGRTAWAEGIGEQLEPIDLPEKWYLVLAPDCHVSTAAIFSHKDLTRDTPLIKVAAFLKQGGRNDCQQLVKKLYPPVANALNWLDNFGPAQMTGTGACVFTTFSDKASAEAVFAQRPKAFSGFVAKGVNRHPAHKQLSTISAKTGEDHWGVAKR